MKAVMMGNKPIEDLEAGVRSAIRIEIYREACRILDIEGKEARRAALGLVPEKIRPHIESEVMRIWRMRKNDGS